MPLTGNVIPHYWFVIADNANGDCVIVNITTLGYKCDKTLILHVGDHEVVSHDSIVFYADARVTKNVTLDQLVNNGSAYRVKTPCSTKLLTKILEGVPKSPDTKDHILEFCGFPARKKANPPPALPPK